MQAAAFSGHFGHKLILSKEIAVLRRTFDELTNVTVLGEKEKRCKSSRLFHCKSKNPSRRL